MKVIKYCLTIRDIMRGTEFIVECESDTELKIKYERYQKDTDYEVVSMYSMLLEIRPITADIWNDKIM
jgi:hypothetical protein